MAANRFKRRPPANPLPADTVAAPSPATLQQAPRKKPPQGNWSRMLGFASLITAIAITAFPTFLVAICGLAPTIVASIVEDRRIPFRLRTIAAVNFAAVIPYVTLLWQRGNGINDATRLLSDPYTLAAMYLGAVAGLALLWLGPVGAAGIFNGMAAQRRRSLEAYRRRLIDEWGDDILSEIIPAKPAKPENSA